MSVTVITRPATAQQVSFIGRLYVERDTSDYAHAEAVKALLRGDLQIAVTSASKCIDELKALPVLAQDVSSAPVRLAVPEGRYAVEHEGVLKFYRVQVPTEGRWAGRTFVSVQASDEWHGLRNRETREAVLGLIVAAGIREASVRYGHELGRCGVCGRTLTDEASRAAGIGPICASKF